MRYEKPPGDQPGVYVYIDMIDYLAGIVALRASSVTAVT